MNFEQLAKIYPSVTAKGPMDGLSSKYSFVSSTDVIKLMEDRDFYIDRIKMKRSKNPHSKHMIFFRNESSALIEDPRKAGAFIHPEILFINSSDGKSRGIFVFGLFTFICSNGLVIGDTWASTSFIHRDLNKNAVNDAIINFFDNWVRVRDLINRFSSVYLSTTQEMEFVSNAAAIRWPDKQVNIDNLNYPVRAEDSTNTLWNVMNRVQEKLINGGSGIIANNRNTFTAARKITSIEVNVKINKELWNLAVSYL